MLLAVDTGGTKTLIAGFDRSGVPRGEFRFPTPRDPGDYVAILSNAIATQFGHEAFDAVVIAVPGMVRDNIAAWCQNLDWENVDIAGFLGPVIDCPIWLQNDANLAGLAETKALDAIPPLSLYVTVSTGIGTGIIIDGHIDPLLSVGEGGHMLLEYDGKLQEWEDFASGRAIREHYRKFARDIHDRKTWRQIADRISRGFLSLIPALQPSTIVIGGSIGTYFNQFASELEAIIDKRLPAQIQRPKIIQAKHPEEAVLYGCYYYGSQQLAS